MIKRGFSFGFLLKKPRKPKNTRPEVNFNVGNSRTIVFPKKNRTHTRLVWKPRTRPRTLQEVSEPMKKVGVGVILALLIYVLLGSPLFVLNSFEVEGNHLITKEEIEQSVFPNGFKPVNLFLFNENKAANMVLGIPQIKEAKFTKQVFSKNLKVTVKEHETTIIWQTNNERFMVNRVGVIYDIVTEDSPLTVVEDLKNVPVNLNQKIVTADFVEFVTSVVSNLPRRTNLAARRVLVPETTFEINVVTSDGYTIIFDTTRSVDNQINNLVKVLQSLPSPPTQYIDLRIEDRVYYR